MRGISYANGDFLDSPSEDVVLSGIEALDSNHNSVITLHIDGKHLEISRDIGTGERFQIHTYGSNDLYLVVDRELVASNDQAANSLIYFVEPDTEGQKLYAKKHTISDHAEVLRIATFFWRHAKFPPGLMLQAWVKGKSEYIRSR